MGTIPHGNSLLAQGTAILVPNLPDNTFNPDAVAPANTAPFGVNAPMPVPGTLGGFPPYDLSNVTPAAVNFRTPIGLPPEGQVPDEILGVPMQELILDPCKLLTAALPVRTSRRWWCSTSRTSGTSRSCCPTPVT